MWTAIPRNVERTLLEVSKVHFRKCPNDTKIILILKRLTVMILIFLSFRTEGRIAREWSFAEVMKSILGSSWNMEYLVQEHPYDTESLEEILGLLVDTCCTARKVIRIAGDDKPVDVVKSQFMKLTGEHIVLYSLA